MIKTIFKFIKIYFIIGFTIGLFSWITDSCDLDSIHVIPIIALLWPLWIFLITMF